MLTLDLKLIVRLLAILACSLVFPHLTYGLTEQAQSDPLATVSFEVTDDAGRRLSFANQPQRIVSLAPHITELLFAAGAGERIVATSQYSDFPPAAKNIPAIGDAYTVNIEALLKLNADLVLVWESGIPIRTIESFDRLNIQYFVSEPKSVSAMVESLRVFGRIAGDVTEANQTADRLQQRWKQLQTKYQSLPPVSIFYQIWHEPLFSVSNPHIIDRVIKSCGGKNIFFDQPRPVFMTQLEAVLAANPDAILFGGLNRTTDKATNTRFWQRFNQLDAVKNERLIALPDELLHRPSPRLIDGAEYMCEQIQRVRASGLSAVSNH